MIEYSVDLTIDLAEPLTLDTLEDIAGVGGAASGNVGERRVETTLTVEACGPAEAVAVAINKLGLAGEVAAAEAITAAEADVRLMGAAFPPLAGVTEVANLLGISRQRLATLRLRDDFPAPVVTLAAGPVWRQGDLSTFAGGWHRKPGRPRLGGAA